MGWDGEWKWELETNGNKCVFKYYFTHQYQATRPEFWSYFPLWQERSVSATDVLQTDSFPVDVFFQILSHPWKSQKKKAYSLCYVVTCAASIRLIYFVRRLSKASFIHVANICVPTLSTTLGLMLERQRQWSPLSSDLQCNDGQRRTVGKGQDLHTTLASERSRAVLLDDWLSSQIEFAERGLRTGQQSKGRKLCSPLSAFLWASANYKGNWKYRLCSSAMQIKLDQVSYDLISFVLGSNERKCFHNCFYLFLEHHFLNVVNSDVCTDEWKS